MTAFRFAGGSSLVRSSASAASRAATSRSPFFAWKNSLVMSSAARIAALCVSTIGPSANTFFSAWSTYAATSRVYSGGKSDRTVYSSPPIITLTACFLVLTHGPPALPELGALPLPPPLPPGWRACSSRNVRRDSRSCTRPRAASTRWRNVLFSCSRSATRFRVSASGLAADPPRPLLSFSSASALTARARHPASSSATWRRMVSSWSSTCASALSPSYAKLTLQRRQPPRQQRIHVPLAQRPRGIAERAVPSHAAEPGRDAGPPILVEHFEPLEQRPHRPPQDIGDLRGGDARGHHQRQVPLERGLQWQRAVCHQVALARVQPYLETEQWSGPNRRVCLER